MDHSNTRLPDVKSKLFEVISSSEAKGCAKDVWRRFNLRECEPEDLLQDVALSVMKRKTITCRFPAAFIRRSLQFAAITRLRRDVRQYVPLGLDPAARECDNVQVLESQVRIEHVLDLLTDDDRSLLIALWSGVSFAEYAEMKEMKVESARRKFQRARRRLQEVARDVYDAEGMQTEFVGDLLHHIRYCSSRSCTV